MTRGGAGLAEPTSVPRADVHPASPPTLRTAGATECRLAEVVELGPDGGEHAVVGFGATTGLAAWRSASDRLAVRSISRDGTVRGGIRAIALPPGHAPHAIYALGERFVIITRLRDWQHDKVDWWAMVVDADALPRTGEVSLGLADHDIASFAHVDGEHLVARAGPAAISKAKTHAERWVILEVAKDALVTTPSPTAPALPPPSRDAIAYIVTNGARPPPHGPGGTIYEAMGRPMLERSRSGTPVGRSIELDYHRNPIAHSMNISPDIAWSGTHFLYPFVHDQRQLLLPIDCKP